jgi:putative ABC transport system permease protein
MIVAQTLYAMTRDHAKELAALKAIGATRGELTMFVVWQAGLLALTGSLVGLACTYGVRAIAATQGMNLVLSRFVLVAGLGSVVAICFASSLLSVRRIIRVDPATVFR